MKTETTQTKTTTAGKPGFFKRMVEKIDTAMKTKADARAEEGCCCGPSESGADSDSCCAPNAKGSKDTKCC